MSGIGTSGKDSTKGVNRYGNWYNTSRKVGGGKGAQKVGTGYSSSEYGDVVIDPSIRSIQEQGLSRINNLYNETGVSGNELISNTRGLRNRFLGNQSDYTQSQLNPLQSQIAQGRGERERSLGLRGVSGSSFADQSLQSYDVESDRALRDARAQTEFQQIEALTGIDQQLTQQMFGKIETQAKLNGESLGVAKERLQQELSALGVGLEHQKMMIMAFESQQNRSHAERKAIADNISSYFGGGGSKTTDTKETS